MFLNDFRIKTSRLMRNESNCHQFVTESTIEKPNRSSIRRIVVASFTFQTYTYTRYHFSFDYFPDEDFADLSEPISADSHTLPSFPRQKDPEEVGEGQSKWPQSFCSFSSRRGSRVCSQLGFIICGKGRAPRFN